MNHVEEIHGLSGLVRLQRSDEVERDVAVAGSKVRPLAGGLLHAVLSEKTMPFVENGLHALEGLNLGDCNQRDRILGAAGGALSGADAGLHFVERHGRR